MASLLRWTASFLLLPLLGGCSGATASTDETSAPDGAEAACADYLAAYCAFEETVNPLYLRETFGTVANCIANGTPLCVENTDAPGTGYTITFLEACSESLSARAAAFEDGGFAALPIPKEGDPCQVVGAGVGGAPCGINAECASNVCLRAGTSCGQCTQVGQFGDPCATTPGITCGRGLVCAQSDQFNCIKIVAIGEPCDLDVTSACTTGSSCVIASNEVAEGTCVAEGTSVGTPCSPSSIQTPSCSTSLGLYCDESTNKCASFVEVPAGSSCLSTDESIRCIDSVCDCQDAECSREICTTLPGAGAPCLNGSCVNGTTCVGDDGGAGGICTKNVLVCAD